MQVIAIFASGAGSNALKIIQYFEGHKSIKVGLIVCNKPQAGVINIAREYGLPVLLIERDRFFRGDAYLPDLQSHQVNFIVLAGFLWKVPASLVSAYRGRIVNIHPALLPKYGGKGMYGDLVHHAVIQSGEGQSGITIHYVDEVFDNGEIIFQERCPVYPDDSPNTLAARIHQLEHEHYPRVIEETILQNPG